MPRGSSLLSGQAGPRGSGRGKLCPRGWGGSGGAEGAGNVGLGGVVVAGDPVGIVCWLGGAEEWVGTEMVGAVGCPSLAKHGCWCRVSPGSAQGPHKCSSRRCTRSPKTSFSDSFPPAYLLSRPYDATGPWDNPGSAPHQSPYRNHISQIPGPCHGFWALAIFGVHYSMDHRGRPGRYLMTCGSCMVSRSQGPTSRGREVPVLFSAFQQNPKQTHWQTLCVLCRGPGREPRSGWDLRHWRHPTCGPCYHLH